MSYSNNIENLKSQSISIIQEMAKLDKLSNLHENKMGFNNIQRKIYRQKHKFLTKLKSIEERFTKKLAISVSQQEQLEREIHLQETKIRMINLQIIYSINEIEKHKNNNKKLKECSKICQEIEQLEKEIPNADINKKFAIKKENFYQELYSLGQLEKFKGLFPNKNELQTSKKLLQSLKNIQKENNEYLKNEEQKYTNLLLSRDKILLTIQKNNQLSESEKQQYSQPEKMLDNLKGLLQFESTI